MLPPDKYRAESTISDILPLKMLKTLMVVQMRLRTHIKQSSNVKHCKRPIWSAGNYPSFIKRLIVSWRRWIDQIGIFIFWSIVLQDVILRVYVLVNAGHQWLICIERKTQYVLDTVTRPCKTLVTQDKNIVLSFTTIWQFLAMGFNWPTRVSL